MELLQHPLCPDLLRDEAAEQPALVPALVPVQQQQSDQEEQHHDFPDRGDVMPDGMLASDAAANGE